MMPAAAMRPTALVALLAFTAVAAASSGCKSAAERAREKAEEKAIEQQTGGQVTLNHDKGTMTIVTDGGEMQLGVGSSIPADFPKSVPVYPGAKVELAAKSTGANGKPAWSVQLETGDAKDKVLAFYRSGLTGFTKATDMDMGDSAMSVWQSPQYDVTLLIGAGADQKTSITLNAASK